MFSTLVRCELLDDVEAFGGAEVLLPVPDVRSSRCNNTDETYLIESGSASYSSKETIVPLDPGPDVLH